jgi:hypothetical protein
VVRLERSPLRAEPLVVYLFFFFFSSSIDLQISRKVLKQ